MDSATEVALRALAYAERDDCDRGPYQVSGQYLAAIRALEARPENRDGADKSWIWPTYEFCRRHFRQFEPA